MGSTQVQQLGAALRGVDWEHFPEFDCWTTDRLVTAFAAGR